MKEGGNSLGADNHCGMTDLLKAATGRLCECSWDARDHKNKNKTRGYFPVLKHVVGWKRRSSPVRKF